MITDGRGNVIAGGNNGGKSHISYKPYGDIHRTDSSGPDITRFKYTGQEEDRESGLLYYKARYYDPMIGRFLQADSIVMPQSSFGMNRYMYVEGNPVRWSDRSGHIPSKTWITMAANYYIAKEYGVAFIPKNAIQNVTREAHNGRKKYLAAYMGSQMSKGNNLSPEQGAAIGMYAAGGKTNIGKDLSKGAGVMAFAMGLNAIINEPGLNDEQRAQRLIFLYKNRNITVGSGHKHSGPFSNLNTWDGFSIIWGAAEIGIGINSGNGLLIADGIARIGNSFGGDSPSNADDDSNRRTGKENSNSNSASQGNYYGQ